MNAQASTVTGLPQVAEDSSPPSNKLLPGEWVKKNLFSSPFNSLVTLVVGGLAVVLAIFAIRWVITSEFEIIRCLLYTSPSPRDATLSRMPSSA